MVLLEEEKRLYVATSAFRKDLKPCRALADLTSPAVAYKVNVMVNVDESGAVIIKQDVYFWVAIADQVVTVIMQFLEFVWPCSFERVEDVAHCDPRMVESGHSVLFPLPLGVIYRMRCVRARRIVLGTR